MKFYRNVLCVDRWAEGRHSLFECALAHPLLLAVSLLSLSLDPPLPERLNELSVMDQSQVHL